VGAGTSPRPAGFWPRAAAWTLDAAVLAPLALAIAWPWLQPALTHWQAAAWAVFGLAGDRARADALAGTPLPLLAFTLLHDPGLREAAMALQRATWSVSVPAILAFAALGAAWNVIGEHSRWRGSGGKRLLGLQVAGRDGPRPGVARSLARHFAGTASWATLNLGHAMAALPPAHLALHDRLAGTRVLSTRHASLPWWAKAWLALLGAALLGLTAWSAHLASEAMLAGLERALY
jgi:uncharacterized RDD family membrane protein YckC